MNAGEVIARHLAALVLFLGGVWGCIEAIEHAIDLVGVLPVSLVAACAVTAVVTHAVTRQLAGAPPTPPDPGRADP